MLLISLKLKDFRQFKGTQQIDFSTDTHRNVTIVLGENGSGKTSLAQAFTWCLYGKTDFDDQNLLCKATAQTMQPGNEEVVSVSLILTHHDIEYTITSSQVYKKNNSNLISSLGQRSFNISYKRRDGQIKFEESYEADLRMKEILPVELSKYFFFDGERIGNMGKDIRRGKSHEFSDAVRSLLGLSAYTEALDHLKRGRGSLKSVIRSYDDKYDSKADSRIADYTNEIDSFNSQIEKIDKRLSEIENEDIFINEKIVSLNLSIKENESSKNLAIHREKLITKRHALISRKNSQISDLLKFFYINAPMYFSKKLLHDSLSLLIKQNISDKWVPDIHSRTIDHLIKTGRCICGAELHIGNEAYNTLNQLRDFIPPKSIGNLIEQFRNNCEVNVKNTSSFFEDFESKYREIRSFESDYTENEEEIMMITRQLSGMQDVGKLQAELSKYEKQHKDLLLECSELNEKKGIAETSRERRETERHELSLKDKNNQRIEIYKTYAQYLYDYLSKEYEEAEQEVREKLSKEVDEIFRSIYNGGFSLTLDPKYNIQVIVNDYAGYTDDVETSTSQSISIIFAFIAGVIKIARASQEQNDNKMLASEPYPLVMDAPLSAFDKTRIQTVCSVLPKIAEQVIIFIKDTDGEIAEKYLSEKIGNRSVFFKKNEFETDIEKENNQNV
jgi:DNA sulfur modification protein DndD